MDNGVDLVCVHVVLCSACSRIRRLMPQVTINVFSILLTSIITYFYYWPAYDYFFTYLCYHGDHSYRQCGSELGVLMFFDLSMADLGESMCWIRGYWSFHACL